MSMCIIHLTCIAAVFLVGGLGFLAAATSLRSWPTLRPNDGLTLGTLEKETVDNNYVYIIAVIRIYACIPYCSYFGKIKKYSVIVIYSKFVGIITSTI